MHPSPPRFVLSALAAILTLTAAAQPVCHPWGNLAGIRVEGELMDFTASLRAVDSDWSGFVQSSKYNWEGKQTFVVEPTRHIATHALQGLPLDYTSTITETGPGSASVEWQLRPTGEVATAGAYFCVQLPYTDYAGGSVTVFEATGSQTNLTLDGATPAGKGEYAHTTARGVRLQGANRQLEILTDSPVELIVRQDFVDHPAHLNDPRPRLRFAPGEPRRSHADYQIYFAVALGPLAKGATAARTFKIRATGAVDRRPVTLTLDPSRPGRAFDGISGNFRQQYPALDAVVTPYCLDNLRVTWGRIAFFWDEWQPGETDDAVALAKAGKLSEKFLRQLEMARDLARRGIPIIVSVWAPPAWAVSPAPRPPKGVQLDPAKLDRIGDSIAGFLLYLKSEYGVEARLFSFNETDCGVEVFQTPQEHALHTRSLGACFAAKGLATKMLLGDTGHGTAVANRLVGPAVADASIHPFIGAIAFHTYHGCTAEDLAAWATSARQLNVPLMVTEGGVDSAAHRYPLVFLEPWFQLQEIDTYVRILAACQPATIMEWQLNADYSVLTGGGLYGDNGPLRPTQRFWNLKQLGATPPGAFALPLTCDWPAISCAALGDPARGAYAIHLVNTGATREVALSGLPASVKRLRVYVTDAERGMQLLSIESPVDGRINLRLASQAFTSLLSE